MRFLASLLLALGLSLSAMAGPDPIRRIEVDCEVDGALEKALSRAEQFGGADISLHGTCPGDVVISTDNVTLRGASPDAGLALPTATGRVLLEVRDAQVSLRNLTLRGGEIGVLADGWDADVLLFDVELSEQSGNVFARNGAGVRIIDSTLRDGDVGVLAQFHAFVNLHNVIVTGHDTGIAVFNESRASISDSTIENNDTGGLQLESRCDAFVSGGTFRRNGQVHIFAGGRSDITLAANVAVGSETDGTWQSLSVNDHSSIASFNTPLLYGDITALDHGSLRLGNTKVEGGLYLSQFSDAVMNSVEITGGLSCESGSDAICRQSTTPSVSGCASSTCGPTPTTGPGEPALPERPAAKVPDRRRREALD